MDILTFLFHLIMMFSGGYVPLNVVKYPKLLMLINKVALVAILIYLII